MTFPSVCLISLSKGLERVSGINVGVSVKNISGMARSTALQKIVEEKSVLFSKVGIFFLGMTIFFLKSADYPPI